MREILGYFLHPETSIDELVNSEEKGKWKEGLFKWVLVAILAGFMTIVAYQVGGIKLSSLTGNMGEILNEFMSKSDNEGMKWLVLVGVNIFRILLTAMVRTGLWVGLLYIVNKLLNSEIGLWQIIRISIYSILTWITSQLITAITMLIAMISPIGVISQMLLGLGSILGYWYLIVFIIGYSIMTRSTFFQGGVIIVVLQAILWGVGSNFPILQGILG